MQQRRIVMKKSNISVIGILTISICVLTISSQSFAKCWTRTFKSMKFNVDSYEQLIKTIPKVASKTDPYMFEDSMEVLAKSITPYEPALREFQKRCEKGELKRKGMSLENLWSESIDNTNNTDIVSDEAKAILKIVTSAQILAGQTMFTVSPEDLDVIFSLDIKCGWSIVLDDELKVFTPKDKAL